MGYGVPGDASILIVDDVHANIVALQALLDGLGATIVSADSGTEALKRVLEQEFAVILLDVQMPGMDGFETAEMIRSRDRSRHTPIIFVTAINKDESHVARGYALGAVDYVFKPIIPEVLLAKVNVFIELFAMRRREESVADDLRARTLELERSNADLAQFAHVAAHDMQEPLRTMTRYLRILSRRHRGVLEGTGGELLDFAVQGAEDLLRLVQDLLTFARLGSQGRRIERIDCETALRKAVGSLKQALSETGGVVTHDPLPEIVGDAGQITRVLQNLIGNGVQFRSDQPPRIHVSCDREGASWRFRVRDNGIGVPAEDCERVFGLFERLEGSHSGPGTGVGLAICRRIIEDHGGEIHVEANPEGGSTFSFTLPPAGERVV